jgi:hypothetical protein
MSDAIPYVCNRCGALTDYLPYRNSDGIRRCAPCFDAVNRKDDEAQIAALKSERDALAERVEKAERERDEALAANAAAVCAWQEYGRWPGQYGAVPIGRYRGPDGVEHEIALRADQITGITRGIMRHIESILPSGLAMVKAMQNESALISRAERAESEAASLRESNAVQSRTMAGLVEALDRARAALTDIEAIAEDFYDGTPDAPAIARLANKVGMVAAQALNPEENS